MSEKPWHEDDSLWEKIEGVLFAGKQCEEAPGQVEHIINMAGIEPGSRVLDLCCGPGRHSMELARRGFQVTGVDRTERYIRKAGDKAAQEGLDIEFIVDDMREHRRPGRYDAVLNIFTSFGYFDDIDDDRKVLRNIHLSLMPGGRFIIDIIGKEILARILENNHYQEENGAVVVQKTTISRNWTWAESNWKILKDGRYDEITIAHRIYSGYELICLLEECGLHVLEVYGGFDASPYDNHATRLIIVSEKTLDG